MVRAFIIGLLALAVGAYLAVLMAEDPGYVLVSFGNWSVETTLVTLILIVVLLFVVVIGLFWLLRLVNPLKLFRPGTWRSLGIFGNARAASEEGLRQLLLGHWQEAYKLLVENAERSGSPVFNYLAACFAAWQRDDAISWNYCLEQAGRKSLSPNPGIPALKALLEYRKGRVEQSLAILLALDKEVPGSPYVLRMIKDIYIRLEDWEKLGQMLPGLEKHKVVSDGELATLLENIALNRLRRITRDDGGHLELGRQWNALPKKTRYSETITRIYLEQLIAFGRHDEAMGEALACLKQHWSDALVQLIGHINVTDPGQQLVQLEKLIKSRPNNSALMLSLGRASLRNREWAKGREYFESAKRFSKSNNVSAEANAELGRLLEHLGDHEKSAASYGRAMDLLDHKLPDLPLPE